MSLSPVMTDEVSNLMASGFGMDVFGEDVEMSRLDDACFDELRAVLGLLVVSTREIVARCGCTFVIPPLGVTVSSGLIWVCILVCVHFRVSIASCRGETCINETWSGAGAGL